MIAFSSVYLRKRHRLIVILTYTTEMSCTDGLHKSEVAGFIPGRCKTVQYPTVTIFINVSYVVLGYLAYKEC